MELDGQKYEAMSFVIEDLQPCICGNGQFCTATLRNETTSLHVSLAKSGDTFVAHEKITDNLYHLEPCQSIKDISDFKDGDEVDIVSVIKPQNI